MYSALTHTLYLVNFAHIKNALSRQLPLMRSLIYVYWSWITSYHVSVLYSNSIWTQIMELPLTLRLPCINYLQYVPTLKTVSLPVQTPIEHTIHPCLLVLTQIHWGSSAQGRQTRPGANSQAWHMEIYGNPMSEGCPEFLMATFGVPLMQFA